MVNGIWLVQPPLREAFLFLVTKRRTQLAKALTNRAFSVMNGIKVAKYSWIGEQLLGYQLIFSFLTTSFTFSLFYHHTGK